MGSTNLLSKSKSNGFKPRSGSIGSDKDIGGKLRKNKIRRPKMNEYGTKRIPDYTELAYKEAVSKLRYFMSGNYSPSVRSFAGGSVSIKNLDESDGDIDKKYYSSTTALTEYKPRPRLAAKYATLYADSLKNYSPVVGMGHGSVAPAPVSSDLAAGTNPDVIHFIQKQEEYIEQLERESQYCRDELNALLGKVKEVISENEHLHDLQKDRLVSKMLAQDSETDDVDDSTGVDSDHKPSRIVNKSWRRSTKLEGPNIVFESRISELEAQLTQAKITLKKVQVENDENKRKLSSGAVDSTCLDGYKRQIDNLQRDKSTLEAQVSKLKHSLEVKECDDTSYKRGSDVIETQLKEERNRLEVEVRRLKDELAKERGKIRELAGEGARRAMQERSAAELRYNAHFDELSHDLAAQYDSVAKLQLELERQRRDENDLKRELSMKTAAIEEIKSELKNKSSTLQADLAQAHAEKASLEEELASARLTMERQLRQAKHETNRLNSEIQSLRQRLDRADADVVHARRENLRLTDQIASLEQELSMKCLTPISPEKKKERELPSMASSDDKHVKNATPLETMINSQNSLMEELRNECRHLKDRLNDANRSHKEELANLQRQVEVLGKSMQSTNTQEHFQSAPTTHTHTSNGDVSSSQTGPGLIHTRPDTTNDSNDLRRQPDTHFRPNGFRSDNPQQRNPKGQESTVLLTQESNIYDEKQLDNTIEENESQENANRELELEPNAAVVEQLDYQQENANQNYDETVYDQNYDPNYSGTGNYANEGYEQQYADGQYDQNYEQYNTENQDQNNTDPIYQNVQDYNQGDITGYQTQESDDIQYDDNNENIAHETVDTSSSQNAINNSPNNSKLQGSS